MCVGAPGQRQRHRQGESDYWRPDVAAPAGESVVVRSATDSTFARE
jgi:hypothetical protein